MKKTIAILLSLLMILGLAACGNSSIHTEPSSTESSTEDVSTESSAINDTSTESPEVQGTKVLVAYFSATNTTEGVAEHIANGLGADLYEIIPGDPYTDANLNYNDNNRYKK